MPRRRRVPTSRCRMAAGTAARSASFPATRGHSRSLSLEACLRKCRHSSTPAVPNWCFPASISGVGAGISSRKHTGRAGQCHSPRTSLPRLRLSSIEPMDWTPHCWRFSVSTSAVRLARHAHLPLQSGSDAILRAMHRRYRPWHYAAKLRLIRESMPDAAIGADVMVGFPGESEALFEESFAFIAAQPFTYLHLFPFSARPGTRAWQLARNIRCHSGVSTERMARLRELIADKNRRFRQRFLGSELSAVSLHTAAGDDTGAYRQFSRSPSSTPGLPANQACACS